jgi:glycosyltransferase involved in cell wall biosynthesis
VETKRADTGWPAFTVVVPAFNAERTIASCIRSVLSQTFTEFELIVVDDGSTDGTRSIAEGFEDSRIRVLHQANGGLPAARNAGTTQAKGEVTCYLDSDDLLLPRYLEVVNGTFAADPGVNFVYTDAWTFDDRTRRVRRATTAHFQRPPRPAPFTAASLFHALLERNFIIIPVAARTSVIVAAGLFDEAMTAVEDWDMWLRLTAGGHRAAEAPGPLGLRRQHGEQMSANQMRMIENQRYTLEKLLVRDDLSARDRKLVERRLERTQREAEILRGTDRLRSAIRRNRHRLGRVRRRIDRSRGWYRTPPPDVVAAFEDLRSV